MSVTQIDIDQDALDRVMALSKAKTKKEGYSRIVLSNLLSDALRGAPA